jgi:hypothetical protein
MERADDWLTSDGGIMKLPLTGFDTVRTMCPPRVAASEVVIVGGGSVLKEAEKTGVTGVFATSIGIASSTTAL